MHILAWQSRAKIAAQRAYHTQSSTHVQCDMIPTHHAAQHSTAPHLSKWDGTLSWLPPLAVRPPGGQHPRPVTVGH
jgi:hypothetical protein